MPDFDSREFISLAEGLLSNLSGEPVAISGPDQAKVRTAIGRSYYAAFLAAREKLSSTGNITPRGGPPDHRLVVDALGGAGVVSAVKCIASASKGIELTII